MKQCGEGEGGRERKEERWEGTGVEIRIEVGLGKAEGWGELAELALIETLSLCQPTRSLLLLFLRLHFIKTRSWARFPPDRWANMLLCYCYHWEGKEKKHIWHHCLDKFTFHCGRFLFVQLYSIPLCSSQITLLSFFHIFVERGRKREERERDWDRKCVHARERGGERERERKRERERWQGWGWYEWEHRLLGSTEFFPSPFESGIFPTCVQRIGIWIKLFLDSSMVSNREKIRSQYELVFFLIKNFIWGWIQRKQDYFGPYPKNKLLFIKCLRNLVLEQLYPSDSSMTWTLKTKLTG